MKSKGCPLPRRFFISDQRLFHKQTFDSYELVNDFIDSTLNKAICGGDAIWITHELKVSTAEIESRKLGKCPLEKDDEIFVMFVNKEWPDELMLLQSLGDKKAFAIKLESVLKTHGPAENPHFSVREIALERRRTKFSQNVGYLPYLNKPSAWTILNCSMCLMVSDGYTLRFREGHHSTSIRQRLNHLFGTYMRSWLTRMRTLEIICVSGLAFS